MVFYAGEGVNNNHRALFDRDMNKANDLQPLKCDTCRYNETTIADSINSSNCSHSYCQRIWQAVLLFNQYLAICLIVYNPNSYITARHKSRCGGAATWKEARKQHHAYRVHLERNYHPNLHFFLGCQLL